MTWSNDLLDQLEQAERRTKVLVDAIERVLPADIPTTQHDDWPLLGWAMLASCAATARDVHVLAGVRSVGSAITLTRRLYELVVTFAWVCINVEEHPRRWLRADRDERLKMDRDLQDQGHEPLLEPEVRAAFRSMLDLPGKRMPDLCQRADQVDRHWSERLDWLTNVTSSTRSLRSLYRYLYRRFSTEAHGGVSSTEHHVTAFQGRGYAHVQEAEPRTWDGLTLPPMLLSIAYLISAEVLEVGDADSTVSAMLAE